MKPLVLSKYIFSFEDTTCAKSRNRRPTEHRSGCYLNFFKWLNPLSVKVYTGERDIVCDENPIHLTGVNIKPVGVVEYNNGWHSAFERCVIFEKEGKGYCVYSKNVVNHIFKKENIFVVDIDIISSLSIDAQLIYALCCYKEESSFRWNSKLLMDDKGKSKNIVPYEEYKTNFLDIAISEIKSSYDNGVCDLWVEYREVWGEVKKNERHPYPKELELIVHRNSCSHDLDLSEVGEFEYLPDPEERIKPVTPVPPKVSNPPKVKQLLSYSEQLSDPRWQKKSAEIKIRDNWKCQWCGRTDIQLVVHHHWYDKKRLAWEYDDEELITLCKNCHAKFHSDKNK